MRALKHCTDCNGERWASLRKLTCTNGALQFKWQCESCGRPLSNSIPHARVESPETIEEWDHAVREAQRAVEAVQRDVWLTERRAQYNAYLASPQWQAKRRLVMMRQDGLCEGCRSAEAYEVHHLTYAHFGAELLFELVALCRDCHERVHQTASTVLVTPDLIKLGRSG